uniref:Beta-lactamase-related domain-containing protein n=1 Tax=Timema poppense TaxID=170557 RepID=A0A7R9CGL8_TIMPO|nr:unnamed protein product [Timema poppensis]
MTVRSQLYYVKNPKTKRLLNAPYVDNSYKWAGGGFLSTVGDLLKFGDAMLYSYQYQNQPGLLAGYLQPKTMSALWTPQPSTAMKWGREDGYGMGWVVVPQRQEYGWGDAQQFATGHSGGAVGASSVLVVIPKEGGSLPPSGVSVAILVNLQDVSLHTIAFNVAAMFREVGSRVIIEELHYHGYGLSGADDSKGDEGDEGEEEGEGDEEDEGKEEGEEGEGEEYEGEGDDETEKKEAEVDYFQGQETEPDDLPSEEDRTPADVPDETPSEAVPCVFRGPYARTMLNTARVQAEHEFEHSLSLADALLERLVSSHVTKLSRKYTEVPHPSEKYNSLHPLPSIVKILLVKLTNLIVNAQILRGMSECVKDEWRAGRMDRGWLLAIRSTNRGWLLAGCQQCKLLMNRSGWASGMTGVSWWKDSPLLEAGVDERPDSGLIPIGRRGRTGGVGRVLQPRVETTAPKKTSKKVLGDYEQSLCSSNLKPVKVPQFWRHHCPKDGIVTVAQGGRLGNQMWEYASTWAVARRTGLEPYVPRCIRKVLDEVFEDLSIPPLGYVAHCPTNWDSIIRTPELWAYTNQSIILPRFVVLPELVLSWVDDIRHEFKFKKKLAETSRKVLESASHSTNGSSTIYVGIHVRRTDYRDYLWRTRRIFLADAQYFLGAMEYFRAKYGENVAFLVVSDDPLWCQRNLVVARNDVFVVSKGGVSSPGQDLAIMAACNHSIIDYGTFGVWVWMKMWQSDADTVAEVLNNNIQADDGASGDEEDNSVVVQERPIPSAEKAMDHIQELRLQNPARLAGTWNPILASGSREIQWVNKRPGTPTVLA